MSQIMLNRSDIKTIFDGYADQRIIYVQAPAGYGKTVAVSQWASRDKRTKTTISLDEYDNIMASFCERFCAAIGLCQPKNLKLAEIITHPSFLSAPVEFALRATGCLSDRKGAVLIIDDLHLVTNESVLALLLALIKRLPNQMKVILISRNDLPKGFSDLWIKGQIARITARQLLFQEKEIISLCAKRGIPVSFEQAAEINRITQGWAIGINAFLLSGGKLSDEIFGYLDDFINENIWEKWNVEIREFMLRTALLHDLNPSLCKAMTGVEDIRNILDGLVRGGVFITRFGTDTFRYHDLFKSFLSRKLYERGQTFIDSLLEAEGNWHLSRHDFYNAAECFIRYKNYDGIAKAWDLLETTDRNDFSIEKIIAIVKKPEISATAKKYPFLLYMMAWVACAEGRANDMSAYADEYYLRYEEIALRDPDYAHNILYMNIWDFRVLLSEVIKREHTLAITYKEKVAGTNGSISMNMPLFHSSTRDFSELSLGDVVENAETFGAAVSWLIGEEWALLSECAIAGLLYEKGELERAHGHALKALAAIKDYYATESKFCAISVLIYILDALESREAGTLTERIANLIEQERAYRLNHNFNALTTVRKLMHGDVKAANEWLSTYQADLHNPPNLVGLYVTFTTCKALIVTGEYDSAMVILKKLLEMSRLYNRPIDIIEALILLAIACWKRKRSLQKEALHYLEEAVTVAYPYGYIQKFAYYGAELGGMLFKLQKRMEQQGNENVPPNSFFKMLYYRAQEKGAALLSSGQEKVTVKFTEKQKAVMKLLCEGKSYKEMAEILEIKLPTLRSHISLIYSKLDTATKIEAINKIKALKLLM